jgi:hypothetical protein
MFEIVVKRPHIPTDWFVSCHTYNAKGGMKNKRQSSMARKSRSRKQRGGDCLGQPLKYTVPGALNPNANAGLNVQGITDALMLRQPLERVNLNKPLWWWAKPDGVPGCVS